MTQPRSYAPGVVLITGAGLRHRSSDRSSAGGRRSPGPPGEDPEDIIHPSAVGPLMVELARGDLEPPLEVKFKDWSEGPGAAALI